MKKIMTALAVLLVTGCATYQSKVAESRRLMTQGDLTHALEQLEKLAAVEDGDQLPHLLDYGVALQVAGQIDNSIKVFLKAEKLAEELDYHSVSRVAGSLLTSEEVVQYKGDTFEKIFINAYLALNYLELGKLDEALVECRRMNEKYIKLRGEEKKNFELNPFAKYLSAVIWEASGQWDDAYIAFSEAYNLSPEISTIKQDLIRSAKKSRRMDEYKKWKEAFPEVEERPEWYDKSYGELIVIFQQGWGPRKDYVRNSHRFPTLRGVPSETQRVRVDVEGTGSYSSRFVYDVEHAAIATLLEDQSSLVARRVGGVVAKEVMADQIRQKNEALGFVAWIFMHASDRADLRQWSLLPQTLQIARIPLKPGAYKYSLQGLSYGESPTSEQQNERKIEIKAGRKVFSTWRSFK